MISNLVGSIRGSSRTAASHSPITKRRYTCSRYLNSWISRRTIPRARYPATAASKCRIWFAQFPHANELVIAPENGSEHFAQNGATMRGARVRQSAHKYSFGVTLAPQPTQAGG